MRTFLFSLSMLLALLLLIALFRVSSASASPPVQPSVHMLSSSYTNDNVVLSGLDVETLTFSNSSTAKLELTSLNIYSGSNQPQDDCKAILDGTTLYDMPAENYGSSQEEVLNFTVTDNNVAAGNRTLVIHCTNNGSLTNQGSVSAIITTGV